MPIHYYKTKIVTALDLDALDHVNNVVYLKWVEEIAKEHWESVADQEALSKYVWVTLNHFIEYKGQAFLDDQLNIKTYIENSTAVTSTRIVEIYKADTLITKTTTNWVLLNAESRKPTRIKKELLALFE